jgi:hypothetical protein
MAWQMSKAPAMAELQNFILMNWSKKFDQDEVLKGWLLLEARDMLGGDAGNVLS